MGHLRSLQKPSFLDREFGRWILHHLDLRSISGSMMVVLKVPIVNSLCLMESGCLKLLLN